jgi:hypothetical protein
MDLQEPVPGIPDAVIRRVTHLPQSLSGGEEVAPNVHTRGGQVLFCVPGAGSFLICDGASIDFTQEPDADEGMIQLFLNGTARGALIHQRGELPLHAATLVPSGGGPALAICGDSGAGKSTLAIELSRRGWLLLADDTTRVTWDGTQAIAWPSRDTIKLWRDACEAKGLDPADLKPVMRSMDKYYVRVPAWPDPTPLKLIVELGAHEAAAIQTPGDKMAMISRNTYRPGHIRPLGKQHEHVRIVARVASACRIASFPGKGALPVTVLADRVEELAR